ncbi:hypothetical protein HYH02_007298 [Chlamydomonas schloesseri]|uniref:Protein kinase domain-containing protein n=1 Tax=Chlamydomonas schloesseri TaxID=2026947 RepID=A0A835WI71_9CHLO|nr:hypothetical protein HYH02_007298 [Chlamydomonas schloesseri]|eukprot:KAG2447842.1 hypothetical protein HYH02_007298 [Chlamydomonas schloesseri]
MLQTNTFYPTIANGHTQVRMAPLAVPPFNAVSETFLDADTQPDDVCRDGGLPRPLPLPLSLLCPARLGASLSCTLPGRRETAPPPAGVCIGALSGEEPLKRPRPSSRPNQPSATSGGGACIHAPSAVVAAPGGAAAAPAAAAPGASGASEVRAVANAASALLAGAPTATPVAAPSEAHRVADSNELHGSGPQVVASLHELLADIDNLSPMATTAAALGYVTDAAPRGAGAGAGGGKCGAGSSGGSSVHTCWQGTWEKKRAVVVKLVAGGGGSGWCRPDAPLLRSACRAARLAAAHPNLARVFAVRALVLDQELLQELRQLLYPAATMAVPRPLGPACLGYAAWAQAAGQREAGLVFGAPAGLTSGVLNVCDNGSAAAGAAAAAAAAAAGVMRPVGRLQRFLMYSPLGAPALLPGPAAGPYLHPAALVGVYDTSPEGSTCLGPMQLLPGGAARTTAAAGLPSQQHQHRHPPPNPQLVPLLRALARLRLPPGGSVVAVVTEMCDMGNLATLACAAESPFRPSRTWPLHVAHRALLRTAREVASALEALHAAGVPHGCLTPSNVLIQSSNADRRGFVARVADAGSPALSDAATNPLASVTPRMLLLPPEALLTAGGGGGGTGTTSGSSDQAAASSSGRGCAAAADEASAGSAQQQGVEVPGPAFAADVFSFGMLLYVMASGRMPYADEHLVPALVGIAMDGRRPEWPTSACGLPLHPHLEPLYCECVAVDPAQRPSAQQVLLRICHMESQVKAAKLQKWCCRGAAGGVAAAGPVVALPRPYCP